MSAAPDSGGEGVAGGFHVSPYHQAWAAQAEQRPGLSLVEEAGVAHIVMGGNNVVDMFDFQINQKQFPPAFFKKDPKTGIQRRFTCLVCNVSLFDENLVRTHCFSQEHYNRLQDPRARSQVSIKKRSVDKRKLQDVLEGSDEPAVGLENIVEWWPSNDKDDNFPVYTCQICDGWEGWGGDTARHVTGEAHRRKQLVTRYPVLEEMIADMEPAELKERAKEEERKHERRYDVIQVSVDLESYQEFFMRLDGKPFRDPSHIPSQPPPSHRGGHFHRGHGPPGPGWHPPPGHHHGPPPPHHHPPGPGWRPQHPPGPHHGPPPHLGGPPPFRGRGHPQMRGGPPGFRGGPPHRGHHPHGPPPPMTVPPPINVTPPMAVPPPTNIPPPISVPPPGPPPGRGGFGPDRGGRGGHRGHFGPQRGGFNNGPHPGHPPPFHQEPDFSNCPPPARGRGHMRGAPGNHYNHNPPPLHYEESQQFSHREGGYGHHPEGHYKEADTQRQDRSHDYYEQGPSREFPREERELHEYRDEKPVKKRRVAPPIDMFDDEEDYNNRRSHSQETEPVRISRRLAPPLEEEFPPRESPIRSPPPRPPPRREPRGFGRSAGRREGRRNRRREARSNLDDDEELPEACYAVSADQEELDTENNPKEGTRKSDMVGYDYRNRGPRERERRGPRQRGNRSEVRYYGSPDKPKKRKSILPEKEETPYEGPTIFDKVFKTKKKEDELVERGERERDKEMEKEWKRYKEETKARIRREKEKLHKYEKKLKELEASTSNAEMTLKEAELRLRRPGDSQAGSSSSRGASPRGSSPPAAYGGRSAAYSSSDSEPETASGPASRPLESPMTGDIDTCQNKFDPY